MPLLWLVRLLEPKKKSCDEHYLWMRVRWYACIFSPFSLLHSMLFLLNIVFASPFHIFTFYFCVSFFFSLTRFSNFFYQLTFEISPFDNGSNNMDFELVRKDDRSTVLRSRRSFDRETQNAYLIKVIAKDGAPSADTNVFPNPNSGRDHTLTHARRFFFTLAFFVTAVAQREPAWNTEVCLLTPSVFASASMHMLSYMHTTALAYLFYKLSSVLFLYVSFWMGEGSIKISSLTKAF